MLTCHYAFHFSYELREREGWDGMEQHSLLLRDVLMEIFLLYTLIPPENFGLLCFLLFASFSLARPICMEVSRRNSCRSRAKLKLY